MDSSRVEAAPSETEDADDRDDADEADCDPSHATPAEAGLPDEALAADPKLTLTRTEGRVEIYSGAAHPSRKQMKLLAERIEKALSFDLIELGVSRDAKELEPPIRVALLTDAAFDEATDSSGTYAVAFDADDETEDAIVLPVGALGDRKELDDTLAHELSHVIQDRLAPSDDLPAFLYEGSATLNGALYGKKVHGQASDFVDEYLRDAVSKDALATFERYGLDGQESDEDVAHDQALSAFFVEYLRVKHERASGAGFSDAQRRIQRVFERVSAGENLSSAFAASFDGLTLGSAKRSYAKFLDATKNNDAKRFGGTALQ